MHEFRRPSPLRLVCVLGIATAAVFPLAAAPPRIAIEAIAREELPKVEISLKSEESPQAQRAAQPAPTSGAPRSDDAARLTSADPPSGPAAAPEGNNRPAPPAASGSAAPPDDLVDDGDQTRNPPLDPDLARLRDQVRRTLAVYYDWPVNARDHSPWEVFHWVIAYHVDAQLYTRGPGGQRVTAVGWLCYNHPCRGQRLLALRNGRVTALRGVGLEGHTGQFLAILGQSRVMADYPIRVEGRDFTVADLVETQKLACQAGTELTFQLIGLAHYLDLDATWKNSAGETWDVPRLIREEIAKPIHGSACGGTHRLMGLSYAVKKRQHRRQPIDGEYRRAQVYVNDYIQYTLRMQNPDGSFSTRWFAGREANPDVERRLQTSGHILEWLVFAASEEQLRDPRMVKAVDYVATLLLENRRQNWNIGHLGHALRSLSLYDRRVFKPLDPPKPVEGEGSKTAAAETLPAAPPVAASGSPIAPPTATRSTPPASPDQPPQPPDPGLPSAARTVTPSATPPAATPSARPRPPAPATGRRPSAGHRPLFVFP